MACILPSTKGCTTVKFRPLIALDWRILFLWKSQHSITAYLFLVQAPQDIPLQSMPRVPTLSRC
ncbi:hypothetical protein NTGHW29_620006 [Candidatus Nitrotoga sp. HW29]|nr:hypothetical protein NTGHW29_620006 [Candidatus Nitrotoga sp. HW29]